MEDDHPEGGVPQSQLPQPLAQHGGRADYDGRPKLPRVVQPGQEHRYLHRFAEAHLVAYDAPRTLRVQLPEPLYTCSRQHGSPL